MIGWYVISSDDTEEYKTKSQAIKRAKELYKNGDINVFIQKFNDNWSGGCLSQSKAIFIKDLNKEV